MDEDEPIEVVRTSVTLTHLQKLAEEGFGDLVKAVVDIDQGAMAIGGGMHADEEAVMLDLGSRQRDLWGINLYPEQFGATGWIEFDSMINLRPGQGNRTRSVDAVDIREHIVAIVGRLVLDD
jgi:Protein of unknown function (DUF5674)